MKSRAISALVFGLCFSIIFTAISLYAPQIKKYTCGDGTKTQSIYGQTFPWQKACGSDYEYTNTNGLPFASKVKFNNSSNYELDTGPDRQDFSGEWRYQLIGILGNFFTYISVGFLFFFIFSRSRNSGKKKKA